MLESMINCPSPIDSWQFFLSFSVNSMILLTGLFLPKEKTDTFVMAGNFWQSSHHQQWLLDKQDLIRERQHDLQILPEDEYQKIFIFFASVIQTLGEQLKLRQQVIATATVYFKRFYAKNSLKCIDPLLLAPTCIFLASKVEEFGVISNSRLITTCQTLKINLAMRIPKNFHIVQITFSNVNFIYWKI
jgi:hypothetical protein